MTVLFHEYELVTKSGLFDPEYYVGTNLDIAGLSVDPLIHYLEEGWRQGRAPSAGFDLAHYLRQCSASGEASSNPIVHYVTIGMSRGFTLKPQEAPAIGRTRAVRSSHRGAHSIKRRSREMGGQSASGHAAAPMRGGIDYFGYLKDAGGWLYSGWLPVESIARSGAVTAFVAQYEHTKKQHDATLVFYELLESGRRWTGFVAFAPGSIKVAGRLEAISFRADTKNFVAHVGDTSVCAAEDALLNLVRPNLVNHAPADECRARLLEIAFRPRYTGQDTLTALSRPVLMEIDEAILCPPNGLVLRGWIISTRDAIRAIRVRSGSLVADTVATNSLVISRPDVIAAVGERYGFDDDRCGFISYVPAAVSEGEPPYLEIVLNTGEIGFKTFKVSQRSGVDAIRRVLADVNVRYGELDPAFDNVLGPAITSLNEARLRKRAKVVELSFGRQPQKPPCSLIIPLYGRIDFVEYQLALFSRHPAMKQMEIIYVLDDPSQRRELESRGKVIFERFQVSFRLLLLEANRGFAPASNIGMDAARGQFVCFLNSDVFPITDDWLQRLIIRLKDNPKIGIIGPRLLFEDGSIQHEGCVYLPIVEYGNWSFVDHLNKGQRPQNGQPLRECDAITGACMVMKRALAEKLGGFDLAYVIGDFEDSDLCRRAQVRGFSCAVDTDVTMYHLERKSQAAPDQHWRFNLTLYNAWVHQRRWFAADARPV